MLKPFFIKKKNIDNRLLPAVTSDDAGKIFIVNEDGKLVLVKYGAVSTVLVELTQEEAQEIYGGGNVTKTLIIDPDSVVIAFSILTQQLLCYKSAETETAVVYRSIAEADLNVECSYTLQSGTLRIYTRNVV